MRKRGGIGGVATETPPIKKASLWCTASSVVAGDIAYLDLTDTDQGGYYAEGRGYSVTTTNTAPTAGPPVTPGSVAVGVFRATASVASGELGSVEVQVAGIYRSANVAATVVAGDTLEASGTAGRAQPKSQETSHGFAIALTAAAALRSDIAIIDHGFFEG